MSWYSSNHDKRFATPVAAAQPQIKPTGGTAAVNGKNKKHKAGTVAAMKNVAVPGEEVHSVSEAPIKTAPRATAAPSKQKATAKPEKQPPSTALAPSEKKQKSTAADISRASKATPPSKPSVAKPSVAAIPSSKPTPVSTKPVNQPAAVSTKPSAQSSSSKSKQTDTKTAAPTKAILPNKRKIVNTEAKLQSMDDLVAKGEFVTPLMLVSIRYLSYVCHIQSACFWCYKPATQRVCSG